MKKHHWHAFRHEKLLEKQPLLHCQALFNWVRFSLGSLTLILVEHRYEKPWSPRTEILAIVIAYAASTKKLIFVVAWKYC